MGEDFRSFIENYRFSCKEGKYSNHYQHWGIFKKSRGHHGKTLMIKLNLGRAKEQGKIVL